MATYDLGDPVTLTLEVRDTTGALVTSSTVTLSVIDPAGAVGVLTPTASSVGVYAQTLTPAAIGTYLYRWVTTGVGAGSESGTFTVEAFVASPAWTPTAEDVERHIPTRGPFDDSSRPTRQQIDSLALSIARGLQLDVGAQVPSPVQVQVARSYVEHATAARVEWGWYPEQQDSDGAGRQHDVWAAAELGRLRVSLGLTGSGTGGGVSGPGVPPPLGAFPPPLLYPDPVYGYGYSGWGY